MMAMLRSLIRCTRASAAAEMVLVLPILLILLFGSVEIGNYFLSEHVIQKGVRDASRYAARLPLDDLTDAGCGTTTDSVVIDAIKNVAMNGDPDSTTNRLWFWSASSTVTLAITCPTGTFSNTGVYADFPDGGPVITVTASVPYQPLFDFLPFMDDSLLLNSMSQAPVFGA